MFTVVRRCTRRFVIASAAFLFLVIIYDDRPVTSEKSSGDPQSRTLPAVSAQQSQSRLESVSSSNIYEFGALYAASFDVSIAMNYVMELLAYQQFLLGNLQGSLVPPPPPPPPLETSMVCALAQTEILGGDIDGMGDRLLLYRNRIKTLEDSARVNQAEIGRLTHSLREFRSRESRETSRLERCIAELRRENLRLKDYANIKDAELTECNKLIDYYKEELNTKSSL